LQLLALSKPDDDDDVQTPLDELLETLSISPLTHGRALILETELLGARSSVELETTPPTSPPTKFLIGLKA
jgi:hypothetical protein